MLGKGTQSGEGASPEERANLSVLMGRSIVRLRAEALGGAHFWLLAAMLVVGGLLHYASVLPLGDEHEPFNVVEGFMHPILLMVPVFYGSLVFGPRVGVLVLAAIALLMFPRILFISTNRSEALIGASSVILVSTLVVLWFARQKKEEVRRQEAVAKLDIARLELASHIELLAKRERELTAINDVCSVVAQTLDLPHILDQIVDKTQEVMDVPIVMVFMRSTTGQNLELAAHTGISLKLAECLKNLRLGDGFNAKVTQSGESMVVDNASEDPRLSVPQVKDEGIKSQLIVPLRSRGLPIGTLCVAVRSSRRFSDDDEALLTAIGSQVGVAIENARLYREALTSEERHRDLFDNATVAIFVQDLDGRITAANRACTDLTGYRLDELIGTVLYRLFPAQTLGFLHDLERSLLSGEAGGKPREVQMTTKSGAELAVFLTTGLISENGHPSGFQHIARDFTEQKRMRDTLDRYVRQVLTAQEDERRRIARELHDETAQSLLLISQRLDSLASDPLVSLPSGLGAYLGDTRQVVIKTLTDLRRLTQDLRPLILDDLGLVAALEWLADNFETQCGVSVCVRLPSPHQPTGPEGQLLLFRIAQEALSNVRRHAKASQVSMTLEYDQEKVRLTVTDNGMGFQVPVRIGDLADSGKLGILGMYERARLLDGTMSVRSKPGQGTVVTAEVTG